MPRRLSTPQSPGAPGSPPALTHPGRRRACPGVPTKGGEGATSARRDRREAARRARQRIEDGTETSPPGDPRSSILYPLSSLLGSSILLPRPPGRRRVPAAPEAGDGFQHSPRAAAARHAGRAPGHAATAAFGRIIPRLGRGLAEGSATGHGQPASAPPSSAGGLNVSVTRVTFRVSRHCFSWWVAVIQSPLRRPRCEHSPSFVFTHTLEHASAKCCRGKGAFCIEPQQVRISWM